MTVITDIAIAIVQHDDRFLIGQRHSGQTLAGLWEFPGGKIKSGESSSGAAVCECLEETGLAVEAGPLWQTAEHTYPHGTVRLHFHLCRPTSPDLAPRAPFRWVRRADLPSFEFPAANADVLRRLMQ